MIQGVGIDLCDVTQIEAFMQNDKFLEKYFTVEEVVYIKGRGKIAAQTLAGHFAAKEACLKALGCGIVLPLSDVAISHNAQGAPFFVLTGKAEAKMQEVGGKVLHLSITHIDQVAAAVAILEG